MPNRLAAETSPYLQQHANNPVDWYPWGPEALDLAAREDKPIFLSIGYSSCHWCHVMERESFEDPAIAEVMNRLFVSIKVDREERPDLDAIYMNAVVAVSGAGGWPMSVFLTPDLKPFYGGTYYPPQDRGGIPSFRRVLEATANAYHQRRNEVVASADQIVQHLRHNAAFAGDDEDLTPAVLDVAFKRLAPHIDTEWGGFGSNIKFPQPMVHEFLLRFGDRSGEPTAQVMVDLTLDRMMRGGIYDHLGGGFHRYATDRSWLVPHFEKMLYDNALLVRLYVHACQAIGRTEYRKVAEETIEFILRDMRDASGGFYTALDADSEGHEGLFYIWSRAEILERLGQEAGERFCSVYGVTESGNFEGANILFLPQELAAVAEHLGLPVEELSAELEEGKATLLAARENRIWPFLDDKVLTGWNALMLGALAEAAAVFDRSDYLQAAEANADFLLTTLRDAEGRLLRTYREGEVKLKGYLEDYAFLVDGLLSLYEATFEPRWLREAQSLAEAMLSLFWDEDVAGFYSTGSDHEELLMRPQDFYDNAIPSGASSAALALLRLGTITGVPKYAEVANIALRSMRTSVTNQPIGYGHWLCAMDYALSTPREVVVVGDREDAATKALLEAVHSRYIPNKVVAGMASEDDPIADELALLEGRGLVGGRPTAYVCQNYACQLPVTDPAALLEQLGAAGAPADPSQLDSYLLPPKWRLNPISEAGE
ncbi:MAG: thioredoxin domain-containing protein [Chloroflexi bacterium]|nr:thioredoxin domain-containing protein [Chloroflexota bacterium]